MQGVVVAAAETVTMGRRPVSANSADRVLRAGEAEEAAENADAAAEAADTEMMISAPAAASVTTVSAPAAVSAADLTMISFESDGGAHI